VAEPPHFEKKDLEDIGSGGKFQVPSLRSVSRTAPYFHDGRYQTLEQAVQAMWEYVQKAGTSEKPTDDDLRDLVEYLKTLWRRARADRSEAGASGATVDAGTGVAVVVPGVAAGDVALGANGMEPATERTSGGEPRPTGWRRTGPSASSAVDRRASLGPESPKRRERQQPASAAETRMHLRRVPGSDRRGGGAGRQDRSSPIARGWPTCPVSPR
jgi:hypothetical protein